jgi:arginyl-tRNA synthetase
MKPLSPFLNEAKKLSVVAVKTVFSVDDATADQIQSLVGFSHQSEIAHAALPCHGLSKILRKAPVAIATELCAFLSAHLNSQPDASLWIKEVKQLNGYLNFVFNLDHAVQNDYQNALKKQLNHGTLLEDAEKEKIIVEFSQPNTHKALHIGHLRNAVYGDAVCSILSAAGHHIVRATYPGDMGAHIAKALWYIKKFKLAEFPKKPDPHWLGQIYSESDQFLKSKAGTPEEAGYKTEITQLFKELEAMTGDDYPLYVQTREWSLQQMRDVYQWLGIHFDVWFYESECDGPSRQLVQEKYKEGFFVLSEGAIGLDLSADDLGFALYLRSDGTGLYLTKDLELIRQKFSDPAVTRSIYIVDSRQKLHFQQLFKTAEKMGYPQAEKSLHLAYESVTDPTGAPFSSRSLNGVSLDQLRVSIRNQVIEQYLGPFKTEWPEAKILELADQIVLGAIKYGLLKVDPNRIIQFILEDWIKLEGETGPYLQYAHARCNSILTKLGRAPAEFKPILTENAEKEIILHIEKYKTALAQAATEYRPSVLCSYLFDLAKLFNRFYKECPIKTAATEEAKNSRLAIVAIVQETLKQGLALLGIPAPERM